MSAAMHNSIRIGSSRSIPLNTGGTGGQPGEHDDHACEHRGLCADGLPFDELEIQLVILSSQLERLEAVVSLMEADLAEQRGDGADAPHADAGGPSPDEPGGQVGAPPAPVPAQRRAAGAGGPPPRTRRGSGRGRGANPRRRR
jgi:hypothetical protein